MWLFTHIKRRQKKNERKNSMVTLTLIQKIGTEPIVLHLRFVTIASIIFENASADVDVKCEFTFKRI